LDGQKSLFAHEDAGLATDAANTESFFSVFALPQLGHGAFSDELFTSVSNSPPHFPHLYSYIGINHFSCFPIWSTGEYS